MNKVILNGSNLLEFISYRNKCTNNINLHKINYNDNYVNENGDYCLIDINIFNLILNLVFKHLSIIPKIDEYYLCQDNLVINYKYNDYIPLTYLSKSILFRIIYDLYISQDNQLNLNLSLDNLYYREVPEVILEYNIDGLIFKIPNEGKELAVFNLENARFTYLNTYFFIYRTDLNDYSPTYKPIENILNYNLNNYTNYIDLFNSDYFLEYKMNNIILKHRIKDVTREQELNESYVDLNNSDNENIRKLILLESIENIESFYSYLLANRLYRLAYRLLNYYPISLEYLRIEHGKRSYTHNRKLINKMKDIINNQKYINQKYINQKYINLDNYSQKGELYDPINLEYINISIEEFLSDPNNIIFEVNDKLIAFNRDLLMNIPNINIINKTVLSHGRLQYLKSYNSTSYLNLNKYNIANGIVPLILFKTLLEDNNYFIIEDTNQMINGVNLAYLEHSPQISQLSGLKYIGYNIQEFQMLQNYTYRWDQAINKYLRSGLTFEEYLNDKEFGKFYREYGSSKEEALLNIEEAIHHIDNAYYNSLRFEEETILYRGVKDCDTIFDGITNSYLSTSKNIKVAKKFGKCLYEYHVQEGVPYIYLEQFSLNKGEEEYLLPRNLLLTYIGNKYINKYKTYIIKVELIRSDQFILKQEYEQYNLLSISVDEIEKEYKFEENTNKCYKNRFINTLDGYYPIDELTNKPIIGEKIIIDGRCYSFESFAEYIISFVEETYNNYEEETLIIRDPYTRQPLSYEVINQIHDILNKTEMKNTTAILAKYLCNINYLLKHNIKIDIHMINFMHVLQDDIKYIINNNIIDKNDLFIRIGNFSRIDLVELCLNSGIDINTQNNNGQTVLMIVSKNGNENIVHILLKYIRRITYDNEDKILSAINMQDKNGNTALMLASYNGHENIVKILLNYLKTITKDEVKILSIINMQNNDGRTALMLAHNNTINTLFRYLKTITQNEDKILHAINIQDKFGYTALMITFMNNHGNILLDYLKIITQDENKILHAINIQDNFGNTVLMTTIMSRHENNIIVLLKYVKTITQDKNKILSVINMQNNKGDTALMIASRYDLKNIINILLEYMQ